MCFSKLITILIITHQFKWLWAYQNQNIVISLASPFKCMIIRRVEFNDEFFEVPIRKLNDFYKG